MIETKPNLFPYIHHPFTSNQTCSSAFWFARNPCSSYWLRRKRYQLEYLFLKNIPQSQERRRNKEWKQQKNELSQICESDWLKNSTSKTKQATVPFNNVLTLPVFYTCCKTSIIQQQRLRNHKMKHSFIKTSLIKSVSFHQFLVPLPASCTNITDKHMPIWSRITLSDTDVVQDNTSVQILILVLALTHPLILNRSFRGTVSQISISSLVGDGGEGEEACILFASAHSWIICHFTVFIIFYYCKNIFL